jgi:ADP-heptose:LPS heptosyltransferase
VNVDRMRQIDYWAGVPLCWLVTQAWRLWRWIKPEQKPAGRDILFIELSEMGSAVIADSAFKRAKALYPDATLHFLIFAKNKPSLDVMGTIRPENILTIQSDNLLALVLDTVKAVLAMRRLSLFAAIDMEMFSRFAALLTFFSGAPNRVGYHRFYGEGLYRGELLTHKVLFNPHRHVAKSFLALVHALGERPDALPHTKLAFSDDEIRLDPVVPEPATLDAFKARLLAAYPVLANTRHWVLLNPNSSELMPLRRWAYENYAELARRLLAANADVAVLVTGVKGERAEADSLCRATGSDRALNLAGFTSMADLAPLYTLAHVMVTNDSGPAHFAAPTGLATIVLFGPESPTLYGALNPNAEFIYAGLVCSPCVSAFNHRKSPCDDARCMKAITVDQVEERVTARLAAAP